MNALDKMYNSFVKLKQTDIPCNIIEVTEDEFAQLNNHPDILSDLNMTIDGDRIFGCKIKVVSTDESKR